MRSNLRWLVIVLVAAVVMGIDQWTKSLVEARVPLNGAIAPFPSLAQNFNIVHWWNSGAAFGILQGQASFFIVVAVVVIVAVVVYARYMPERSLPVTLCLGLQLGGAFGNLIDRLTQDGHVTDFLLFMLPVGDRVYQWPAFNVADMGIVGGTIGLGIFLFMADGKEAHHEATEAGSQ
jgi:signal peptidase II